MIIKNLYLNGDNEMLLRFPVNGAEILLSKSIYCFLHNIIVCVAIMFPFYFVFGAITNAGVGDFFAGLFNLPKGTFDIDLSILKTRSSETGKILDDMYKNKIKPFCDAFGKDFKDLWNNSLSPMLDDFVDGFKTHISNVVHQTIH